MPPPRKHVILFFGIVLFLSSWHLFGVTNDNVTSRAAMVAAIVEQGTLRIDDYADHAGDKALINGHYYSEKAPLPALLVVPFWWVLRTSGITGPVEAGVLDPGLIRLGGFLTGSIPFALIITLIWWRLRERDRHKGLPASIVALCACFGSFLFLQSGTFFGHLSGALFLLAGFMAWERGRMAWCGAFAGCAVLCEYTNAIFPLTWALLLVARREYPAFGRLIIGGLPAALLLAGYNWTIASTPFTVGYTHQVGYDFMHEAAGFGLPDIAHLWHITFSDYRGLFFYMPVLLPAVIALFVQREEPRWWTDPVILPALATIIAMSGFGGWWGGWTYGPRYLTAVAVLLLYRGLPSLSRSRWSTAIFLPLALFGLFCTFAAKDTVGFSLPTGIMHPLLELVLPAIGNSHSEDQWPMLFGLPASWCSLLFPLLFAAGLCVLSRSERRSGPA